MEVTPTTAPYLRSNKPLYEERLKELQKLRDEIVFDIISASYKDLLLKQVFDSITVLGSPDRNEIEEIVNYGTAYVAGIATGVIGKDILSKIMRPDKDEKQQ